jgi:hypothetical protein
MTITLLTALAALLIATVTAVVTLWRVNELQNATLRAAARARRLEKLLEGARHAARTTAADPEVLRYPT